MTSYRRHRIEGGAFFFTVVIADRHRDWLVQNIESLRQALRDEQERAPFVNLGLVVLPDHLHAMWRLPAGDADYSNRWRRIKAAFSRALPPVADLSPSRLAKGERGIWQRRFWEHTIRDDNDLRRHLDYLHFNPVKHGLVARVIDWPHSSFHAYVERGVYPRDWGGVRTAENGDFGE